jgi:predicted transcriptional regulator
MPRGGHPLDPSEEQRRRDAYFECADDVEAAKRLGLNQPQAFGAWRRNRGLPTKIPPGAKKHLTPQQQVILEYLKAHGWSRMYAITRDLQVHSWSVYSMLQSLETKELVDVCVLHRIKQWALAGTPPPERAMRLMRGFPSPYHGAHVPDRIKELLAKEKWLTAQMIAHRLGSVAAVKTVEERVRELYVRGELQRQVIDTPIRRMNVYALKGTPYCRGRSAEKIRRLMHESSPFWKTDDDVLELLGKTPWLTAADVSRDAKIRRGYVFNALTSMEKRGLIRRIRARSSQDSYGRTTRFLWGPRGAKVPNWIVEVDAQPNHDMLFVRVATIVKDLGTCTRGSVREEFSRRHGTKGTGVERALKTLVELGVVTLVKNGRYAGRYSANGSADAYRAQVANVHWSILRKESSRLRELGYRVTLELRPPSDLPPQLGGQRATSFSSPEG